MTLEGITSCLKHFPFFTNARTKNASPVNSLPVVRMQRRPNVERSTSNAETRRCRTLIRSFDKKGYPMYM